MESGIPLSISVVGKGTGNLLVKPIRTCMHIAIFSFSWLPGKVRQVNANGTYNLDLEWNGSPFLRDEASPAMMRRPGPDNTADPPAGMSAALAP
eukprot:CAMPEP_0113667346 /NCGR_PEP_ID=MMETSP0038_2-20120614/3389_1 /TAXON_ID=2898 /ORGANISM="Cryptomonas paramecium" /LENGTH=93 /DNA_ID=CAMNT_0000582959 /DNA_START=87 /DNA_END=364 /DNA_ORIENTATION=- /assembly_acc=CAM_ASM_000170